MFGKRYKQANKPIKLSEAEKNQMYDQIHAKSTQKIKMQWLPIGATTLAICLIVAVALNTFGLFNGKHNTKKQHVLSKEAVSQVKNYSEVYDLISATYNNDNFLPDTMPVETAMPSMGFEESDSPIKNEDFSQTNTQIQGVDEADTIKTDGNYIYILSHQSASIAIFAANGTEPYEISRIDLGNGEEELWFSEMYLYEGKLAVYNHQYQNSGSTTVLRFYDVSNPQNPKLISTLKQDGDYIQSRLTDGILYTVSTKYIYDIKSKDEPETYIPAAADDGEKMQILPAEELCILCSEPSNRFSVITSVDMTNTDKFKSKFAGLGGVSGMFASKNSIILYENGNDFDSYKVALNDDGTYEKLSEASESSISASESRTYSELYCIRMGTDKLTVSAQARIKGAINDRFSIDEYNEHFRIVTTLNDHNYVYEEKSDGNSTACFLIDKYSQENTSNSLYILDSNLKEVGKIEDIAKTEHVKSARFMGDIGYFVTFRRTDPLFSVDLSDPENPKILGELKIPGFSTYMQSYGENLLFGFGAAADIESGIATGIKLSMFDTSDPSNVKEIACTEIEGAYSSATYNPKAILANCGKNIIAFPLYSDSYAIYSYDNGKFVKRAEFQLNDADWCWNDDMRGLYIGDVLYVIDSGNCSIETFDISAFN